MGDKTDRYLFHDIANATNEVTCAYRLKEKTSFLEIGKIFV